MLERYNDIEIPYEEFLKNSLIPVMRKCLSKNVYVCLYIPDNMYKDICDIFGECKEKLECRFNNRNSSFIYCWKY